MVSASQRNVETAPMTRSDEVEWAGRPEKHVLEVRAEPRALNYEARKRT